jgi:group I intron endonuclease
METHGKMIGIYRIRNKANDNAYYGSSKNIKKRWYRHRYDLSLGVHANIVLQRAWDKYGENEFVFEVIEECLLENLHSTEQKYLDSCPVYNIGLQASGGDNLTNHPNKDEIIKKRTATSRAKFEAMTEEERRNRFSKPGDKNYNWKGGISKPNCITCGKPIGPTNVYCRECMPPQTGERNPFYGRHHTEENKKYLSELHKGKRYSDNNHEITINGVDYKSYLEAAKLLNACWGTLRWRVLSKNPKYKDYNFKGEKKICDTPEERKERHGEKKRGVPNLSNNKPFTIDGVEYRTLKEASETLGIHKMTIKQRILSKNEKFNNYSYICKQE